MDLLMNYVDVSSSILFEATADSEADSDINSNMDGALLTQATHLADDDALSCSYDDAIDLNDFDQYPTASSHHSQFDLVGYDADHKNLADDEDYEDEDEDEDEDEEGVVDQLWNGDSNNNNNKKKKKKAKDLKNPTTQRSLANYSPGALMEKRQRRKKLKICAEEFMNQRENDKLFWETCLAS